MYGKQEFVTERNKNHKILDSWVEEMDSFCNGKRVTSQRRSASDGPIESVPHELRRRSGAPDRSGEHRRGHSGRDQPEAVPPGVYDSPEASKSSELQLADCQRIIEELNTLVASFRDLLIHIGKGHDNPDVRDKMRGIRKKMRGAVLGGESSLMPQIRK
ncbi:regulator of G-protein signaling 7-binding protein A [Caerostris extrusa]|uniref:Regulator of G-protein signaling 7-binding protein A n=1 Tax=Caerostris extrusa TaxID=172846 RepID=A0AAV4W224_CAEEX|nr:regulator of G-protein signaling 7-binding protein A [Caerostris extrusa]